MTLRELFLDHLVRETIEREGFKRARLRASESERRALALHVLARWRVLHRDI